MSDLDPARVGYLIEALYHDDDENLGIWQKSAISQIRGTAFVGVALDDIVHHDQVSAWQCLIHRKDSKETATRLAAMIDLAYARLKPNGVTLAMEQLARGRVF